MSWLDALGPRERAEVRLAQEYVKNFNHGTSGHLAMLVIVKLATLVERLSDHIEEVDKPVPEQWFEDWLA